MRSRRFWIEGPGSFLVAIALALIIRWAFFEAYVIPSSSMLPTLLIHDHIFVNKITMGVRVPFTSRWIWKWQDPARGDVVVFKHPQDPKKFHVKRLVGLPGDRVYYENGNLYVNDQLLDKAVPSELAADWGWVRDQDFLGESQQGGKANYVHWQESLDGRTYSIILRQQEKTELSFGPYTVPPGHFFVIGDNRDNSQDSREWDPSAQRASGEVTLSPVSGQAEITVPAGTVVRTNEPGTWSQRFKTENEAILKGQPVTVAVRAVEAGSLGNVAAGAIQVVDGPLSERVQVQNPQPMSGGDDKRFIPRELMVGRAVWVWLSCERKLPMVTFLCDPTALRWGRIFHRIH